MHRKIRWLILGMLPVFLTSCAVRPKMKEQVEVVKEIRVTCEKSGEKEIRSFTQPEALEEILTYLRRQHSLGQPALDPERLTGPRYTIQVTMSGGGQHIYYQFADAYFSKDYRPWQIIDRAEAAQFETLFRNTPGKDLL